MRRSRALFLLVIGALIATSLLALASASGQCTKAPESKSGGGCSAAASDNDTANDDGVEIVKLSARDFEKTIAGEDEEGVTLILFEDGQDRPAISAAFKEAASALDGLGVTAATIDSSVDSMLSEKQGGGSKKTAVRAFYSMRLDKGVDTTERKPSWVAAGGPALSRDEDGDRDGPLADPVAIASVAFEAMAAAAAARLGGGAAEASALLSRSASASATAPASSSSSSSSSTSSKTKDEKKKDDDDAKKASKKEDEKSKKKKKQEEEQKRKKKEQEEQAAAAAANRKKKQRKEQEDKKKKAAAKDNDKRKAKSSSSSSGSSSASDSSSSENKSKKSKKKRTGRINEGGGYFASSTDIDALGDATFDANVFSSSPSPDDEKNDSSSSSSSAWMVMFYAPWCGHCKQLAPEYEKLPQLLASRHGDPRARIAAVDCDRHKQACSRQGVQGFPTLKFFKAGSSKSRGEDYRGPRDAESIAAFIAERAPRRPAEIVELTGNDVLEDVCPPAGNSDLSKTADEAAALPRLCLFAFVPDLRDSSAAERSRLLDVELRGAIDKKFAGRPYAYLWSSAGAHPKIETAFSLGYGFPALVAYVPPDSVRKGPAKIVHLKGAFDAASIGSFVERVRGGGGGGASAVEPSDVVASDGVAPWDGKDLDESERGSSAAEEGGEEEFSLADLGLDVPSSKDEL